MRKILIILLVVILVGCGQVQKVPELDDSETITIEPEETTAIPETTTEPETEPEPLPIEIEEEKWLVEEAKFTLGFILADGSTIDEYEDGAEIMDAFPILNVTFENGVTLMKSFLSNAYDHFRPGQIGFADLDGDGNDEIVLTLDTMASFAYFPFYILRVNDDGDGFDELYHTRGLEFGMYFNDDYTFTVSCDETGYVSAPEPFYTYVYETPYVIKDGKIYFPYDMNNEQNFGVDGVEYFEIVDNTVEVKQYAWAGPHAGCIGYAVNIFAWKNGLQLVSQRFDSVRMHDYVVQELPKVIESNSDKIMYLTFDDGPSPKVTPLVLDILKEHGIKATFFVVGAFAEVYPDLVRRVVDEGHAIALHSYTHDFREIYTSADAFMADLRKVDEAVCNITGVRSKIIRFPGGSVNGFNKVTYQEIVDAVNKAGYVFFDWNASLQDAVTNPVAAKLFDSAVTTVGEQRSVVMLVHDRIPQTAEILGELLDYFSDYSFEVITPDVSPVQFKG
ncbi:MAG: polysaccharide deacetylase [Oscillospiraceae bacterium]|nr:polysaccharide deacetylase [Oscillospiraceae bacterium]